MLGCALVGSGDQPRGFGAAKGQIVGVLCVALRGWGFLLKSEGHYRARQKKQVSSVCFRKVTVTQSESTGDPRSEGNLGGETAHACRQGAPDPVETRAAGL